MVRQKVFTVKKKLYNLKISKNLEFVECILMLIVKPVLVLASKGFIEVKVPFKIIISFHIMLNNTKLMI